MTRNSILRVLRISFLSTMLALLAVMFLVFSASAHATVAGKADSPAAKKTVDIVKTMSGYNFSPSTEHVHPATILCAANMTNIMQTITYKGKPAIPIAAHKTFCAKFGGTGTFVYSLKSNPKAKLTVISTP